MMPGTIVERVDPRRISMAKKGRAIFLVYTDLADEKYDEEFNAWYDTQHRICSPAHDRLSGQRLALPLS